MRLRNVSWASSLVALSTSLTGCPLDSTIASNCPGDGGCVEQPVSAPGDPPEPLPSGSVDAVDMLFVIDDSRSMAEEQALLREEIPRLVRTLVSGDRSENGSVDFRPPDSVHFGVITTNLGTPGLREGQRLAGCSAEAPFGDDAMLITEMRGDAGDVEASCQDSYPEFLKASATDDPLAVAADLRCLSSVGIGGCGFEQPLEAALKALAPAESSLRFYDHTTGHGSGHNAGFLRSSSLLAVVVVTDEDDCSSHTTDHFASHLSSEQHDELPPEAHSAYNARCHFFQENLHAVERYAQGLQEVHPAGPDHVVFGAIAGLPTDLVDPGFPSSPSYASGEEVDRYYDELLDDPRMQEELDEQSRGGALRSACTSPHGDAKPARRLIEVARGFGRSGVVQSICEKDFRPPMDGILQTIAQRLGPPAEPAAE